MEKSEFRLLAGVSLVSLLLCVYGLELVLASPRLAILARLGGFDPRLLSEVVREERAGGVDVYPNVIYNLPENSSAERFLLAAPAGKKLILCNESGTWVSTVADEFGFRNPPGLVNQKPELVLIGDSFAEGYCVADEETPAARLRRHFPKTVTVGKSNWGPWAELATYREYVQAWRPKLVVWFYYGGNDGEDFGLRARGTMYDILPRYLRERHLPEFAGRDPRTPEKFRAQLEAELGRLEKRPWLQPGHGLLSFLGLKQMRSLFAPAAPAQVAPFSPEVWPILELVRAEVEKDGGAFLVVNLPSWRDLNAPAQVSEWITGLQERRFHFVDLEPVMRASGDPLRYFPLRRENHYNAAGYELVAEEIIRAIEREKLMP